MKTKRLSKRFKEETQVIPDEAIPEGFLQEDNFEMGPK